MIIPIFIFFFMFAGLSLLWPSDIKYSREITNLLFISLWTVLVLIVVFRSPDMLDYHQYHLAFINDSLERAEIGYRWLQHIVRTLTNNFYVHLFIMGCLSVGLKLYAIKKLSSFYCLSILIYLSNIFILHDMIQIRAAVASGIILISTYYIHNRKFLPFLILLLFGALFHKSIIVLFPIWFINTRKLNIKIWLSVIPIAYILAITNHSFGNYVALLPIESITDHYNQYQLAMKDGYFTKINIFNSLILLRIAVCSILTYNCNKISKKNSYIYLWVKIYIIAIACAPLLSDFPVLAGRISELLLVIEILLLPLIVFLFNKKDYFIGKSVVIGIGLTMLLINTYYIKILL